MDWLTFVASETHYLAWPAVVLASVLTLRKNIPLWIETLVNRVKELKVAGVELGFEEEIDKVEKEVLQSELEAPNPSETVERASSLSSLPPKYIVSQAWSEIESQLAKALSSYTSSIDLERLVGEAGKNGLIPESYVVALNQLRDLRNQAAHSPTLTLTDALRYDNIARTIKREIAKPSKQNKDPTFWQNG